MAVMKFKDAEKLLEQQMPGWRIVKTRIPVGTFAKEFKTDGFRMKFDPGPSLSDLRKKYLGVTDAGDNRSADIIGKSSNRETFLIEPKDGGPAKTADVRDGKVIIVQG